jgi:Protein of unknown function (DUF3710)
MFGRRRHRGRHYMDRDRDPGLDAGVVDEGAEDLIAPFDEAGAPNDGIARLDLGSVRLPIPDGSQLQVEMDSPEPNTPGPVRAVHLVTPDGQLTVSAYAAPRSGGLWREVSKELADQLRDDGARVRPGNGEWGAELVAAVNGVSLRFVGVDGPRWMLRGVAVGPEDTAAAAAAALDELVRGTVVVRGAQPMPVRTPLPLTLPEEIAQHIQQQTAEQS